MKQGLEQILGEVESSEFMSSEQSIEFEQQILPFLNSNVDFLDILIRLINAFSKKSSLYNTTDTAEINKGLKQIRKIAEKMRRKAILSKPSSQEKFKQALQWFAANGDEEELELIKNVRQDSPDSSDDILRLFDIAEKKIRNRVGMRQRKRGFLIYGNKIT